MSLSASSNSGSDGSSLKSAQLRAIYRMLAFNQDTTTGTGMIGVGGGGFGKDGMMMGRNMEEDYKLPPAGSSHNQWKILIYDTACRSIISPLLNVSQLRRRGVTLHLLLQSDREPIPDVPAVYFVSPTKENLARIAQDCSKRLYSRVHLNFLTRLDRSLMEEFAKLVVQSGSLDVIASVHDQYLDYVCFEKHLFSLHKKNSYVSYNGVDVTESMIESYMTEIAYGLFSVIASLGQIPIIRCPKGGAPEMVARKLNRLIAEHPTLLRGAGKKGGVGMGGMGGGSLGMGASSYYRPLLVIFDRNADLVTPCQHTSTYQALIDDVLDHKVNRVEFDVDESSSSTTSSGKNKKVHKKFDLDPDEDPFYCQHKFQPFPEAIESNGVELQEVTEHVEQIRSAGGGSAGNAMDPLSSPTGGSAATDHLASAVDSLPALLDRKKQLEVHTSILQAVMNDVAARDIPQFYELESSLATGTYKNDPAKAKKDVTALVSDSTKGNIEDKIRLVIVYCLSTMAKTNDVDDVLQAMEQSTQTTTDDPTVPSSSSSSSQRPPSSKFSPEKLNTIRKSINYIQKLRSMNMMKSAYMTVEEVGDGSATDSGSELFSSLLGKGMTQASGLLAKAKSMMLGKGHKHPITRVVENLCDMKPNSEDDEYLYLDPKVKGDVDVMKLKNMSISRSPIQQVVAFVIGGGCYSEYQNMIQMLVPPDGSGSASGRTATSAGAITTDLANSNHRTITYGSTELLDAGEFLYQLGQLG